MRASQSQPEGFRIPNASMNIFCHKHHGEVITHGCVELNCENAVIMCEKCFEDDPQHSQKHRLSIMQFWDYIQHIASEIGRIAAPNSSFLHKNVSNVLQREAYLHESFENQMKEQRDLLFKSLDEMGTLVVHHLERIKHQSEHYFAKQFGTYRSNMLYFKQSYKSYNPEDTYTVFSDPRNIKQKVLIKSPIQAYHFLAGLRKAANMEGQLLSNLNYMAESISTWNEKYPVLDPIFYDKHLKKLVTLVQDLESDIQLSLKEAPAMNIEHSVEANQNLISQNRKDVRINSYKLFQELKFNFQVVAALGTMHTNSATSIVALTEDIAATSSYDRSIKIWRLQDGKLLKQIDDSNSVCALCVFKFSNKKNPDMYYYSEEELEATHQAILRNVNAPISNFGLLLISGGLDRLVKIWDFDFSPETQKKISSPAAQLSGHSGWITQIISLEDEQNIISGDDTGELIICKKKFAASSGETIKIWQMNYKSETSKSLSSSLVPKLVDCQLERSKGGILKYIDLNLNKMVTVNTDHRDIIGDIILIEKLKIREKDFEYFHRNINFVLCGTKKLGLYNGYGNILEDVPPANAEDFCSSSIIPNRNMTLLKVHKRGNTSFIRIGVLSQFQSDFYSYQSSRISLLQIKSDFQDTA